MKATVPTYETIPEGIYPAVFGEITESEGEFGRYWRWEFHCYLPEGGTESVSGISSTNFGPRSKANKWATALLGRQLEAGELVDFTDLQGAACQLSVTVDPDSGFNKIEKVSPKPAGQAAPAVVRGSGFVPPDEIPF